MATDLVRAAASLRKNSDIVIKKSDKCNSYVILDTLDYLHKLDEILADNTKFQKISKNPTQDIKVKANRLIAEVVANDPHSGLKQIIGDFSPGYIYGNIKTHKEWMSPQADHFTMSDTHVQYS